MFQHAKKHPGVGWIILSVHLSDCYLWWTTCFSLNKLMMSRNTKRELSLDPFSFEITITYSFFLFWGLWFKTSAPTYFRILLWIIRIIIRCRNKGNGRQWRSECCFVFISELRMTQIRVLTEPVWQFTRRIIRAVTVSKLSTNKTPPASVRPHAKRWSSVCCRCVKASTRKARGRTCVRVCIERPACIHVQRFAYVCLMLNWLLNERIQSLYVYTHLELTPVYERSLSWRCRSQIRPRGQKHPEAPRCEVPVPPRHPLIHPYPPCYKAAFICCFSYIKMVCCALKVVAEGDAFSPSVCTVSVWRTSDVRLIKDMAIRQKTDVQIQLSRDIRQLKHIKLSSLYSLTKCAWNSC